MNISGKKGNWINQEEVIPKTLALKLQDETEKNPAFEALMQVLAVRERTRKQIILRTMLAAIRGGGTEVERGDVAMAFRFLAAVGVGTLIETNQGQVEGLRDIQYSLTSVAEAALTRKPGPRTKLMTADHINPSMFVKASPTIGAIDHLANAAVSPSNARKVTAGTLVTPTTAAALRHSSNSQPGMQDPAAQVLIKVGKNELKFEITTEMANTLIKQLLIP